MPELYHGDLFNQNPNEDEPEEKPDAGEKEEGAKPKPKIPPGFDPFGVEGGREDKRYT